MFFLYFPYVIFTEFPMIFHDFPDVEKHPTLGLQNPPCCSGSPFRPFAGDGTSQDRRQDFQRPSKTIQYHPISPDMFNEFSWLLNVF